MTVEPQKRKRPSKINFPIIFLVLVFILTIGLYSYNMYIDSENKKIETRISDKEKEIKKIKKDENIKVYSLLKENKRILDKLESYSQISIFLDKVKDIETNYGLILEGFNYSKGVISTKAITDPEKTSNAYLTVSDFIEKYRKNDKAIFKLPYITKVIGNSKMAFNLKLEVKDNFINNKK